MDVNLKKLRIFWGNRWKRKNWRIQLCIATSIFALSCLNAKFLRASTLWITLPFNKTPEMILLFFKTMEIFQACMENEGHFANAMTFSSVLKACGNTGAIEKGKHAHRMIVSKGLLEKDIVLGNGLIDMYARCGMLAKAQEVLEELPFRNNVSWSALISGYAQHGQGHKALECFERMQTEGLSPDEITFVCVLSACSHSGLLNEAKIVFQNMTREFSITPNVEHLTCMLVSLGCAGQIDKAMLTIGVIPSYNRNGEVCLSLLGACRKWGNTRLGRLAFRYAVQLELNINELIKGQVFSLT